VSRTANQLVDQLEAGTRISGSRQIAFVRHVLSQLPGRKIRDAGLLIRLHETLLFLTAYPPNKQILSKLEHALGSFEERILQLRASGGDLSPLDAPEVSGIAGTSVTSNFSYDIVRWLVKKYPRQLSIDWDWFENEDAFGARMPRFLPLLDEDAMVEAHVPYREWVRRAAGRTNEVVWLIDRFESLNLPEKEKARLYDSLQLHVRWQFDSGASRTGMRLARRKIFFHRAPLIQRRDVSLAKELESPPIPVEKLSRTKGEKILDLARATSAVRYRELHGFTYGDPRQVLHADLGRGTEAHVVGVAPEQRLPLRAYHAAIISKNGIPVAYFEGLSLFERMESGFNLYYTFREGETAWLFARILRLMRQLLGVNVVSIEPYQIGHENEEGIESGAFWFYRKLGFRPARPELMKLTLAEEKKMKADPGYRTPARTLRRLAAGYMLLNASDLNEAKSKWDRFAVRNIGFAVQRRIAREFSGDPDRFRAATEKLIRGALGKDIGLRKYPPALKNLAPALMLIPGLTHWSDEDKHLLARIVEAKTRRSESLYLKLMQLHKRLRAAMIGLGS
jgi:hypothetical protein